ncbi:MAG: F0F1 ATP synthase subunit epsilon [Actinobacteria bacterium]|jgi:F-type H+-transporting ATPase subunit epsilon|nr:F0F1 ATP synthase subunit epsilon [Actinomycetota bacterium]NCZ73219.1 F0F1 ATP synthase subunit epsilon [Actinomycetota bacterium]NDB31638.1 F0F1 ATP synthase subunit epsilon [Actinomycetota bacterium]NDC13427.1 F0F1 ATP synthase subunit epsilon [Actinomycetota bacterium]NDC52148.1 F0F1 ATP synthase subunit epsilon [Actinomycetota bacterium]
MPGKVLTVEFVTPESRIWSGEATMLSARTLDGDLGIMPDHAPLFGVLVDGKVTIKGSDGKVEEFTVNGGFLSVSNNRVSVLGESSKS